jgi:hypothetical protein
MKKGRLAMVPFSLVTAASGNNLKSGDKLVKVAQRRVIAEMCNDLFVRASTASEELLAYDRIRACISLLRGCSMVGEIELLDSGGYYI